MPKIDLDAVKASILRAIAEYREERLRRLRDLSLDDLVGRKNPYLFRVGHGSGVGALVRSILDARLSSSEETRFGNLLKQIAEEVCKKALGGRRKVTKKRKSFNLVFTGDDNRFYFVSVRSGPNWGNASSLDKMRQDFRTLGMDMESEGMEPDSVMFVEGCYYGAANEDCDGYRRVCGQAFWSLISGGNEEMYRYLITLLGCGAEEHEKAFRAAYEEKLEELTKSFRKMYGRTDDAVDWDLWIRRVSGRRGPPPSPPSPGA